MRRVIEKFYLKCGIDDVSSLIFSWFTVIGFCIFMVARIGVGMYDANKENECVIKSINDLLLSPLYGMGCVMAKDRWDIKIN